MTAESAVAIAGLVALTVPTACARLFQAGYLMMSAKEVIRINLPLREGNGHLFNAVLFHLASNHRKGIAKFIIIRLEIVIHNVKSSKASATFSKVSVLTLCVFEKTLYRCPFESPVACIISLYVGRYVCRNFLIRTNSCSLSRSMSFISIY
jgi:hypothetical protein